MNEALDARFELFDVEVDEQDGARGIYQPAGVFPSNRDPGHGANRRWLRALGRISALVPVEANK